jgi:hypothetical protein
MRLDDGKPFSARVPSVKFPRPAEIMGVRRLYVEFRGFLLKKTRPRQMSGGPMLKSALEGLKGRRSRQMVKCGVRVTSWTFPGSDLFRLPKHLYPPRRR